MFTLAKTTQNMIEIAKPGVNLFHMFFSHLQSRTENFCVITCFFRCSEITMAHGNLVLCETSWLIVMVVSAVQVLE